MNQLFRWPRQSKVLLIFIMGFGVAGAILLGLSRAAPSTASFEAETGTITGNGQAITDSRASAGHAVHFGKPTVVANAIIVSPSGNDTSGSGSVAAPYKTVAKAQSVATAGSTVYLRGGTYAGTVNLTKSGSSGNPITYAAYPGETVVINASSNTYYGEAGLYIKSLHDIQIQNIEFANGRGQGVKVENSQRITLSGNKIHDSQLGGLVVSGDSITLSRNEIYNCVLANNAGQYGSGGWPAAVSSEKQSSGSSTNISFLNNYSHDNWGEGIDAWFVNTGVVSGNQSTNNYSVDIYADDSKDMQIINNTVSATNSVHNRADNGHPPTGIAVNSETGTTRPTNMLINGNTLSGNLYAGIVNFLTGATITQGPSPQNF